MLLRSYSVLPLILLLASANAQTLPAGTRDATDNSRQEAANSQLRDAESALERGDYAAAMAALKPLAAERPKDPHILYDLGFAQERTGAEAEAAGTYDAASKADAAFAEPRVALGLLDARAGRLDKAHAELAEAAAILTASPDLRARAYRALARIDETAQPAAAGEELLAAIKLTGETPEDTALSAALAARGGDPGAAEAAYRRVLVAHPDDPEAAAGLAHVLVASHRAAEAEQVLSVPLKAHPGDPQLLSQMSAALAAQGKVAEAIPVLLQLRSDPRFASDVALIRQLARLYALDGQNARAEELFAAALSQAPSDVMVMDDYASVLVREEKYAEAEKLLTSAVSRRDQFPSPAAFGDAAGHLAFAASKSGHPEACLRALQLRATVLPNSAPSLFLEATALDSLHQYKQAQRAYQAFLATAAGQFPDQEFQARHRLVALAQRK
jgi:tetratricopeptide (TPR) repeat protein